MVSGLDKNGKPITAPALFLFVTEDGTLVGWNPGVDPTGKFDGPGGASTHAVIAVDNSGNNFTEPDPLKQTGAVYKGMSIATSASPIFAGDASSTSVGSAAELRPPGRRPAGGQLQERLHRRLRPHDRQVPGAAEGPRRGADPHRPPVGAEGRQRRQRRPH